MFAVTTSLRNNHNEHMKAMEISSVLNIPYIPRKNKNINEMFCQNKLEGILVAGSGRLTYKYQGGDLFFHLGMVKLRIKEIINGKTDQMIKALDLNPGDSVLDCTMGLGWDSIVAAYLNGEGEVTGLERSRIISFIAKEGLSGYCAGDPELEKAMRKIKVICCDYNVFLKKQADNSVDIIYFDPMFRIPAKNSSSMEIMRPLTDRSTLTREAIQEALRVARRRVVVKETRNSTEFLKLGIDKISGGRYSSVSYGIIEKGGGGCLQ